MSKNKTNNILDQVLDVDLSGTKRVAHPEGEFVAMCTDLDIAYIKKEGPNKGIPMLVSVWTTENGTVRCQCATKAMSSKDGKALPPYLFASLLKNVLGISADDAESMKKFKPSELWEKQAIITVEHTDFDADGEPYANITKFRPA